MKKLLALCSALLLTFTAHAAQFEEGKHYKVLDVKKASKPVVASVDDTRPKIPKGARRIIKRTIWDTPWLRSSKTAFVVLDDSEKTFYNSLRSAIKNAIKRSKELSD